MVPMATAGVLMVLVNIGFLVAGAMLFSSSLESSGWADALTGTDFEPTASTATTILRIMGHRAGRGRYRGCHRAGYVDASQVTSSLMLLRWTLNL
ncbi:hypothetical protein PF002_g22928 [Phytophthora fragariae]|nr:hypothetical protein PF007_g20662 [Phytophthora fragariae]KAE9108663.1 hypothetical protein PF006_g20829 [Phytophthora fragariae]KAE9196844.1 hypothetical protein PF002_g22928 [Phytophthora fragariae]KAE9268280.1 hypothetical protein PF001_g29717 [Phytophthora fragariae]